MCGIFGVITTNGDAPQKVLEGLKRLEYRGYDSWGVASVTDDERVLVQKDVGKIGDNEVNDRSNVAIGHTRWATHGGVTKENAHPHVACNGKIAVVHNGIIDNFIDLKQTLQNNGHEFKSETDSEVVAHMLESEDVLDAFKTLQGLNAVVMLNAEAKEIWAAKNGSPLVIGYGKDEYFLASDAAAILPHTKRVVFLEDGQGVRMTNKGITIYTLPERKEIEVAPTELEWDVEDAELSGFDHFQIKEISEQPGVMRTIINDSDEDVDKLARLIKRSYGTYFVACGTAYNACLAGVYMFSNIANRHVNHASGAEFKYLVDFITRGSLVVSLSQSGETIDTIESVAAAKKKGATTATVVNVMGSTLYRNSDARVLLHAGPEKSVLATKSYVAMLTIMLETAYTLVGKKDEGRAIINEALKEVESIVNGDRHTQMKELAKKIKDRQHIYLIGRGAAFPTALEGALKIKEVSYIHAEGFAGGELKHGSIALIDEGTPVIVFAPEDETYDGIISNAMEVKARGAYVIGVSHVNHQSFDEFVEVKNVENASNITQIIPIQLLAYYLALELDRDPDKPRNLAKSVTVR